MLIRSLKVRKIPFSDGINFGFINDFWEVIKEIFYRFTAEFHMNGRRVREDNCVFLTLISKRENLVKLNDCRSISLIRSMYKV